MNDLLLITKSKIVEAASHNIPELRAEQVNLYSIKRGRAAFGSFEVVSVSARYGD